MKSVLVVVCILTSISLFAQEDVSASRWQSKEIVVDGNDNEWNKPLNFFDNFSGLIFSVTNDDKNLYLCFSNNDKVKTGKMMAAGWSLEISCSEKKRKFDVTIAFPKSTDPNINKRSDLKTAMGIYKAETKQVNLKGFISINGELPLVNKDGPVIGIGADEQEKIVYEISLPIRELMQDDKVKLNELFTFDITVNALPNPEKKASPSAPAGGQGGFGGGRMGGGRGGGRMGDIGARQAAADANASTRAALYEKVSFKQKIRLVGKEG